MNERLKPFVSYPDAFRFLQAQHNILITDEFTYEFITRRPSSTIGDSNNIQSLLFERGAHHTALIAFLEKDGYALEPPPPDAHPRPANISYLSNAMSAAKRLLKCCNSS
jgi:hypothetical protein